MHKKSLYLLLALLVVTKGLLYCLVLPPWIGPDEPIRFEYARLFFLNGMKTLIPAADEANQQSILRSMTQFKIWEFLDLPQPDEKGHAAFYKSPLQKDTASYTYPPLYYLLTGYFWRELRIQGLLPQLYSGRILSLVLSLLQLVLAVHLVRRAWPAAEDPAKPAALAFMAFLPQWGYLSSSVHSDNWSNMLSFFLLLLLVKMMIASNELQSSGQALSRPSKGILVRQSAALGAALILMALSSRATSIVVTILGIGACPFLFRWVRRVLAGRSRILLSLALVLIAAAVVAGFFLVSDTGAPDGLNEALGRGLMQRGSSIPMDKVGTIISRIEEVSLGNLLRSLVIIFSTFWLALGILVYKLSPGWLLALGMGCAMCLYGWMKRPRLWDIVRADSVWLLFWTAPVITIASVIYLYGPHQASFAPEGRYLLLVLPAIAILLTEGWQRCFEGESHRIALSAWICGWILLDAVALFQYILPLYYLRNA